MNEKLRICNKKRGNGGTRYTNETQQKTRHNTQHSTDTAEKNKTTTKEDLTVNYSTTKRLYTHGSPSDFSSQMTTDCISGILPMRKFHMSA